MSNKRAVTKQELLTKLRKLQANINCARLEVDEFQCYLSSDKFRGTDRGERKDWIATADVSMRLAQIKQWLDTEE